MKLTLEGIKDRKVWEKAGISLPSYDMEAVAETIRGKPVWAHFSADNIFRIFINGITDVLISEGTSGKGITCAETFSFDVTERTYKPYDNLVLGVILKVGGSTDKKVTGSLTEALKAQISETQDWKWLKDTFADPGLQVASPTIAEKGYALKGVGGAYFPLVQADIDNGPENIISAMAVMCSLLYERYKAGKASLTMVSTDNCSYNGGKPQESIITMIKERDRREYVEDGLIIYLPDHEQISFPWSMIDKTMPHPADSIQAELENVGVGDMIPVVTSRNMYAASFVNAGGPQYLVIEDCFPNEKPALEKAGVYMTDRDTVNKVERMKVTIYLNPFHTTPAVYGCVLGYTLIADEMKDPSLNKLVCLIGPGEGMPVVADLGILPLENFVNEVIDVGVPNPFMLDAPQRITTDISQKIGTCYEEIIKAYVSKHGGAGKLTAIPLAIAGWCRYLLAVDDEGKKSELSVDPIMPGLTRTLGGIMVNRLETYRRQLKSILSNANTFGIDFYEVGIGGTTEEMFREEAVGPGAVRVVFKKYLNV